MGTSRTVFFERVLGEGGFGKVYQGYWEGKVPIPVAVKLARGNREALARLYDEAQLLARLNHPGVVKVRDLVKVSGTSAIVMDLVEGTTLTQVNRALRRIPTHIALDLAGRVAAVLQYALTVPDPRTGAPLRLVHRDIKPGNLMLTQHGEVKVLDFGIARADIEREAFTVAGQVPYSEGYRSPERINHGAAEAPADVYALGAVLYRMVAGEVLGEPPRPVEPALYEQWLDSRLSRLVDANSISDEVHQLLLLLQRMLTFDPQDRLTAQDVVEACERQVAAAQGPSLRVWAREHRATLEQTFLPDDAMVGRSWEAHTVRDKTDFTRTQEDPPPPPPLSPPPPEPPSWLRRHWPRLTGATGTSTLVIWLLQSQCSGGLVLEQVQQALLTPRCTTITLGAPPVLVAGGEGTPLPDVEVRDQWGKRMASPTLTWVSSNPAVLRAQGQGLQGLAPGRARLTATCEGGESTVEVEVQAPPPTCGSVRLSGSLGPLRVGERAALPTATARDAQGEALPELIPTWVVLTPELLRLEGDQVTALAAGAGRLEARCGEATQGLEVNVQGPAASNPVASETSQARGSGSTRRAVRSPPQEAPPAVPPGTPPPEPATTARLTLEFPGNATVRALLDSSGRAVSPPYTALPPGTYTVKFGDGVTAPVRTTVRLAAGEQRTLRCSFDSGRCD